MRHTKVYEMQFSPNLRGVDVSDACTGCVLMRSLADAQFCDADALMPMRELKNFDADVRFGCAFLLSRANLSRHTVINVGRFDTVWVVRSWVPRVGRPAF